VSETPRSWTCDAAADAAAVESCHFHSTRHATRDTRDTTRD
jgi:hypothetical protein